MISYMKKTEACAEFCTTGNSQSPMIVLAPRIIDSQGKPLRFLLFYMYGYQTGKASDSRRLINNMDSYQTGRVSDSWLLINNMDRYQTGRLSDSWLLMHKIYGYQTGGEQVLVGC